MRRITLSFTFLMLIVFAVSAQQGNIKKAREHIKEQHYDDALSELKKANEKDDEVPEVHMLMGQCYRNLSNSEKAVKHAKKAVDLADEPTTEMYKMLAKAYHLDHEFGTAIKYYKKSDPKRVNWTMTSHWIDQCKNGAEMVRNPVDAKISGAGPQVNTEHPEYLPQITADMQTLYFTSRRPEDKSEAKKKNGIYNEDVYRSSNVGGAWQKTEKLGKNVNTKDHDACVGLSPDGHTMFIYRGQNKGDIFISELEGGEWSEPEPFERNSPYLETSVSLSPDGRTMYLVKQISGSRDIYVSNKSAGGGWSSPRKIGGKINTRYEEESPFMHPDGKTLYFSSKGHSSMGGYDVFKTVKQRDGSWSEPENLGYPINTGGDDVFFVLAADGEVGFYSSEGHKAKGKQDIFSIQMPFPGSKPRTTLLKGKVKNSEGEPVRAEITITDNEKQEVIARFHSNSETGKYLVSLPIGKNYGIRVEKEGKLFYSENVNMSVISGYKEVEKNIELMDAEAGSKVVLDNIFFESGEHKLKEESKPELNRVKRLMESNLTIKVEIAGHTDSRGDEKANKKLSQKRAQAVVDYLVSKGIDKSRLVAKGYGEKKPIASNETEKGRKKNRRVEFKVIR